MMTVYQMFDLKVEVLDEGNCWANLFARVTGCGEEACGRVRKRWVGRYHGSNSTPRGDLIKAARSPAETWY